MEKDNEKMDLKKQNDAQSKEKISVEQRMEHLKNLVSRVEDGQISIDDSFKAFEEANDLIEKIKVELNVYKKRVEEIVDAEKKNEL